MLADDFLGRVTLDPLCTGIPARYEPLRVEHEDRIVDDRLDKQPECVVVGCSHHLSFHPPAGPKKLNPGGGFRLHQASASGCDAPSPGGSSGSRRAWPA